MAAASLTPQRVGDTPGGDPVRHLDTATAVSIQSGETLKMDETRGCSKVVGALLLSRESAHGRIFPALVNRLPARGGRLHLLRHRRR